MAQWTLGDVLKSKGHNLSNFERFEQKEKQMELATDTITKDDLIYYEQPEGMTQQLWVYNLVTENRELHPKISVNTICRTLGVPHSCYHNQRRRHALQAEREAKSHKKPGPKPKPKMEESHAALPLHKKHEILHAEVAPQPVQTPPPMFGRFKPSEGQVLVIMGSPEQVREMMQ